jgi:hypothetical protein
MAASVLRVAASMHAQGVAIRTRPISMPDRCWRCGGVGAALWTPLPSPKSRHFPRRSVPSPPRDAQIDEPRRCSVRSLHLLRIVQRSIMETQWEQTNPIRDSAPSKRASPNGSGGREPAAGRFSRLCKLLGCCALVAAAVALGVGLGVGLARKKGDGSSTPLVTVCGKGAWTCMTSRGRDGRRTVLRAHVPKGAAVRTRQPSGSRTPTAMLCGCMKSVCTTLSVLLPVS